MDYYGIDSSGNLHHWGVKGMKWGVRRYQNKNGGLTPLGKKRRAEENAKREMEDANQRHLSEKARRQTLSNEQTIAELSEFNKTALKDDFDASGSAEKRYLTLDKEIRQFSGDWYESSGVSDGFKSCVAKREALDAACDSKYTHAVNKAADERLRTERDAIIKNCKSPANRGSLKNDRISDMKDYMQARTKALNDPAVKRARDVHEKLLTAERSERAKIRNEYNDELLGVVLRDLGYKDTPETRRLIEPVVIWD